jgi:branched-chain amino acid transport system permease protein
LTRRQLARAALVVGALVALVYPLPLQWYGYTYFQTVGFLVLLNAMLGIGWNVIGGWTGQFDFAPQVFFAIGGYAAALLFIHLGLTPWLGMVGAVLLSVIVCAAVTYPITRLRGHYFAIATVAMWMIAHPIGATWEFINGSRGLFIPMEAKGSLLASIGTLQFAGRTKSLGFYYVVLVFFALTLWVIGLVGRSKLGYYFRAIRDDQEGAEGIGVPSRLYKVIARCITAAVFAVGGVLYSFWALAVFPDQVLDINWGIIPTMAAVVGGIGRLWGAVLGSIILIPISQIMSTKLGTGPLAGRGIDLIAYGLIIMIIAAARPQGLLSLPWGRWIDLLLAVDRRRKVQPSFDKAGGERSPLRPQTPPHDADNPRAPDAGAPEADRPGGQSEPPR